MAFARVWGCMLLLLIAVLLSFQPLITLDLGNSGIVTQMEDLTESFGELDPENHASDVIVYSVNSDDAGKHDSYHGCCNVFIESVEHTGGEATCIALKVCEYCEHEYGELDPENHADVENHTVATCKTLAKCSACEAEYGSFDPENHESDGFAIIPSVTDSTVHEKYHSCCDVFVESEAHSGGEATCKTRAICEICKVSYGSLSAENHESDELIYTNNSSDEGSHNVMRSCCGADGGTEAHSGGKATCHGQAECDKCGASYGELADHVYDNACDTVCNECNQPTRGMVFHKDANGDRICDECGADVESSEVGAVTETPVGEGALSGRAISAIAVGSTAAVGAGSFSLVWFVIQKKSWAELFGLLIG